LTGFSTISPTAMMSPVVPVMITSPTMHIAMIALTSKVGKPKWKGVLIPNHDCSAAPLKSAMPKGTEIRVPMIRPLRMDSRWMAGEAKRSISRMITSVISAKTRFFGLPKVGLPEPPPAQPAATDINDKPMIKITVPVTRGGKNRSSLEKTGASNIMNSPQAITDP